MSALLPSSRQSLNRLTVEGDVETDVLEELYLLVRPSRSNDLESFTLRDLTSDLSDSS